MTKSLSPTRLCLLVAGAALLGTATPSFAQSDADEMVVTGRYGKVTDSTQSLSQTVSYADLDLSTVGGRAEFRHRLRLTARYLCEKLGETDTGSSVAPSCRDAAVSDAMKRAGTLEAHVAPRGTTWVAGPAWSAPYPGEWVSRYPD